MNAINTFHTLPYATPMVDTKTGKVSPSWNIALANQLVPTIASLTEAANISTSIAGAVTGTEDTTGTIQTKLSSAILNAISSTSNAKGYLINDGQGNFSYSTPSTNINLTGLTFAVNNGLTETVTVSGSSTLLTLGLPSINTGTIQGTTITATTGFSGPGTGLTGTASSLSIGGNATTVTGLAVVATKILTVDNTLTLQGTDLSTLNIGSGGTLGSGAFASLYTLPTATSSILGGVKPDGTSILNTAGVISVGSKQGSTLISASPTGTTSTTAVMMGLAASLTPAIATRMLIIASGQMANSLINDGTTVTLKYGTGTAPTNGAAVTGTTVGIAQTNTSLVATSQSGFCLQGYVTGLTAGVAYWADIAINSVTGGTSTITGVSITMLEV